jgi:hypothetical protein
MLYFPTLRFGISYNNPKRLMTDIRPSSSKKKRPERMNFNNLKVLIAFAIEKESEFTQV